MIKDINYKDFEIIVNHNFKLVNQRGFKTILILADEIELEYTLYNSLEAVQSMLEDKLGEGSVIESKIYKLARKIFNQVSEVAIIGKTSEMVSEVTTENRIQILNKALAGNWFMLTAVTTDLDSITEIVQWAEVNEKAYFGTRQEKEDLVTLADKGNGVIGIHDNPNDLFTEAVAGILASKDIGSTVADHHNISGSSPADIDYNDFRYIEDNNGMTYVSKRGVGRSVGNKTITGEWIDVFLSRYFIKFRLEEGLDQLKLDSDKIPYTDQGINMIEAKVREVMDQAINNGILINYVVTKIKRKDVATDQVRRRNYDGLKVYGVLQGAISTGTITVDLIHNENEMNLIA